MQADARAVDALFSMLDTNCSGTIEVDELIRFLQSGLRSRLRARRMGR